MNRCPRCGSEHRATPKPVAVARGGYTCRHAWHMPAHTDEAQDALGFVADVERMFSGDVQLPESVLAYDPYRQSTAGYP